MNQLNGRFKPSLGWCSPVVNERAFWSWQYLFLRKNSIKTNKTITKNTSWTPCRRIEVGSKRDPRISRIPSSKDYGRGECRQVTAVRWTTNFGSVSAEIDQSSLFFPPFLLTCILFTPPWDTFRRTSDHAKVHPRGSTRLFIFRPSTAAWRWSEIICRNLKCLVSATCTNGNEPCFFQILA